MKAIISIALSQRQRSIYDQEGCWLWQGKKGKNLKFFLSLSIGVFTLIKLVFETQAEML